MNLEGIMPSEISQTGERQNTVWSQLYVESYKAELMETDSRLVVATAWWVGEMGDAGQSAQASAYE